MDTDPLMPAPARPPTPDLDPAAAFLRSPSLGALHAFSTRAGGVSLGAYAGLNLDDREDDPALVAENRRRLTQALGLDEAQVARLNQVHGTDVVAVTGGGVWTADALVTATPGVALVIATADCLPVLLHDPHAGVVGAAHAGWKGTLGRIAARTVEAMAALGAQPERIQAAVGPGICAERYPVGPDVARQFREAGLGDFVVENPAAPHLDLAGANAQVLLEAGLTPGAVWQSGRCSTEPEFYSYRRDAGRTGRMWAVIALPGTEGLSGARP